MSVNERIVNIIETLFNGNKRAFSQAIGVSAAVIENIVGKRQSAPSFEVSNKIILSIDNINADWLITGRGDMFNNQQTQTTPKAVNKKETEETRPRIPYTAAAGSLTVAMDGVTNNNCEQLPVIKAFARYDFTIFAYGDSMIPEYHSGDELACVYVRNTNFIQWGRVHVIDTAQGILVKRIFDGGDSIICRSDNPDYPEFCIDKSEFYNVALVIGMVRRY